MCYRATTLALLLADDGDLDPAAAPNAVPYCALFVQAIRLLCTGLPFFKDCTMTPTPRIYVAVLPIVQGAAAVLSILSSLKTLSDWDIDKVRAAIEEVNLKVDEIIRLQVKIIDELKELGVEEIKEKVEEWRRDLFGIRLNSSTSPFNPFTFSKSWLSLFSFNLKSEACFSNSSSFLMRRSSRRESWTFSAFPSILRRVLGRRCVLLPCRHGVKV